MHIQCLLKHRTHAYKRSETVSRKLSPAVIKLAIQPKNLWRQGYCEQEALATGHKEIKMNINSRKHSHIARPQN